MSQRTDSTDYFFNLEAEDLRRERAKARELRGSQWWKRRLAKGVCHYCGRPYAPRDLTMDHIIPVSRGGRTIKGNVVPCCKECNNAKKQLLPMEWEDYLKRFERSSD
jgi:5-methylcytosine-specific restriction enzyme A